MIDSYPSIYNLGHRAVADLFSGPVIIEEKVDGSQFSFGVYDGELACRSKGKQLVLDAPEKMFVKAVASAQERAHLLRPNWTYRCEYLSTPKHNTLAYDRVPVGHLMVFDICPAQETYLSPADKAAEAQRIGLECVPVFFEGVVSDLQMLNALLGAQSVLGGAQIEGIVVKRYDLFTTDHRAMMGKYVSEAFKEQHTGDWRKRNPTRADAVEGLIAAYRTEARWRKAVQHLREDGKLTDSPKDIGALVREVPTDVLKEDAEAIKEALFRHFWPQIQRGILAGLPEWYKQQLAAQAFDQS